MKAELARQKYDVSSATFWDSPITEGSSVSWRESCENSVLDTLRMYLAALVLFDENGLKLTDEYYSSIDEDLDMYLDLDADGSKSAFNELLAAYGVSYDTLRQAYADEYRVALLQTYLYGKDGSLIGNNVKEEYFEENYYCFRQVLFAKFYYEYKTDDFGNVIYYDTASASRSTIRKTVRLLTMPTEKNTRIPMDKPSTTMRTGRFCTIPQRENRCM